MDRRVYILRFWLLYVAALVPAIILDFLLGNREGAVMALTGFGFFPRCGPCCNPPLCGNCPTDHQPTSTVSVTSTGFTNAAGCSGCDNLNYTETHTQRTDGFPCFYFDSTFGAGHGATVCTDSELVALGNPAGTTEGGSGNDQNVDWGTVGPRLTVTVQEHNNHGFAYIYTLDRGFTNCDATGTYSITNLVGSTGEGTVCNHGSVTVTIP